MTTAAALHSAAAASNDVLAVHFWHGVEAVGFLVVTLGGLGIIEWRERRRNRPAEPVVQDLTPPAAVLQRRTNLLTTAALFSAAAAGVHYVVMPEHFHESVLYGGFFLVTATAQIGYAVLLVTRPSRPLIAVGALANAAVVALWLVTRLVAIPLGPAAGSTEEFSGLDILASSFEAVFLIAAVALLLPARRRPMPTPRRISRVVGQPATLLAVVAVAALIGVTAYAAPPS